MIQFNALNGSLKDFFVRASQYVQRRLQQYTEVSPPEPWRTAAARGHDMPGCFLGPPYHEDRNLIILVGSLEHYFYFPIYSEQSSQLLKPPTRWELEIYQTWRESGQSLAVSGYIWRSLWSFDPKYPKLREFAALWKRRWLATAWSMPTKDRHSRLSKDTAGRWWKGWLHFSF